MNSIFPKAHGMPAAVYFDDQLSSVKVSGCVFEQIAGRVMLLGGGRVSHFRSCLSVRSQSWQGAQKARLLPPYASDPSLTLC